MGHNHHHNHNSHNHSYKSSAKKKLLLALVVNSLVMGAEIIGGIITGSLALLSDAGHMFTHLFALTTSLFAIILASRPVSDQRSFGFFRAEVLASFVNSFFLIGATIWIAKEAIERMIHPTNIATGQMIVIASIGLITNLISFFLLKEDSHSDINIRSAFLHVLTDTFSSVAIIIGGIVIYHTGLTFIDPLLSMIIGVLILVWAWRLIRESTDILLEASPRDFNAEVVKNAILKECQEVRDVHDLHCWVITGNMNAATLHVFLDDCLISEASEVLARIRTLLDKKFNIRHVNIQIEQEEHACPHPCEFRKKEGCVC